MRLCARLAIYPLAFKALMLLVRGNSGATATGFGASRAWPGHSVRMRPLVSWQGRDHTADSVAHKRLGWRCSNRLQCSRSAATRSALCLLPHAPTLPQRRARSGSRVCLSSHSAANLGLRCAQQELQVQTEQRQASNVELEALDEVRVRRHAVWLLRSGRTARAAAQVGTTVSQ